MTGTRSAGQVRIRDLADGLTLTTRGRASVVALNGDIMVPTLWGGVRPESVGLAQELGENK
jgi:hypothetical protein